MSDFFKGAFAGFIGGLFVGNKRNSTTGSNNDLERYEAAEALNTSVNKLKDSLAPFEGNTLDDKYRNFLKELKNTSFNHLPPIQGYKQDYAHKNAVQEQAQAEGELVGRNVNMFSECDDLNPYKESKSDYNQPNPHLYWEIGFFNGWNNNPNNSTKKTIQSLENRSNEEQKKESEYVPNQSKTTKMKILIHRDGDNYGPYTLDQVKEYLTDGTIIESDLAWHEGCASWHPVTTIISSPTVPPPPPTLPPLSLSPTSQSPLVTTLKSCIHNESNRSNIITSRSTKQRDRSIESIDLIGLPIYYQEEFRKIYDSREMYQGKWNWAAFLFAGIWALVKGCWFSLIVWLIINAVVASFTCGIGMIPVAIVYWFIYGKRGTYMYYYSYVKRRQLAF